MWRGILFGGGAGFVVGFVEGLIGAMAEAPAIAIRNLALASGVIVGIPVGVYVVLLVLRKNFREFTIRLVPTGVDNQVRTLPANRDCKIFC
jgi:hypothetical protein